MRSCARYSQAADDKTIHGHTSESNHTFKKIYQRTSINCQKIWQAIILLRIGIEIIHTVNVKVTQSCPTFCHPMELYSLWDSPGWNTGVGSHSLLREIFPTQGLNAGLLHCRQILYQVSHQGSPRILEWVTYPFSSRSSQPMNRTGSPALQAYSLPAEL